MQVNETHFCPAIPVIRAKYANGNRLLIGLQAPSRILDYASQVLFNNFDRE
jgi:hypothetical protein